VRFFFNRLFKKTIKMTRLKLRGKINASIAIMGGFMPPNGGDYMLTNSNRLFFIIPIGKNTIKKTIKLVAKHIKKALG
tara:strand:+ start:2924 stop:3157 length:234 start_codon:yes stop_codon:yes gene_type:complete